MDDGSGSALVMDMLQASKRIKRKFSAPSFFFLVTAEEKGLLGSKYFAAHPTVAPKSIVADVNVDMFLPIVPLKILKIEGLKNPTSARALLRLRSLWASNPSLIPSRCATRSSAAISTASSRRAFPQ